MSWTCTTCECRVNEDGQGVCVACGWGRPEEEQQLQEAAGPSPSEENTSGAPKVVVIELPAKEKLGVKFMPPKDGVIDHGVAIDNINNPLLENKVQARDLIVAIGGQNVDGMGFSDAIDLIRKMPRPLAISFEIDEARRQEVVRAKFQANTDNDVDTQLTTYVVVFDNGPMGLNLEEAVRYGIDGAVVRALKGQARTSGKISIGDILCKVNETDLLGVPYGEVMNVLRLATGPKTLQFVPKDKWIHVTRRHWDDQITVKKGYMYKQGRKWKLQYFVLTTSKVQYFNSPCLSKLRGELKFWGHRCSVRSLPGTGEVVCRESNVTAEFLLEIRVDNRRMVMACASEDDKKRWMDAVRQTFDWVPICAALRRAAPGDSMLSGMKTAEGRSVSLNCWVSSKKKQAGSALIRAAPVDSMLSGMKTAEGRSVSLNCWVSVMKQQADTALMRAAALGSVQGIRLLVQQGEDVNAKNKGGDTAVMFAARNGEIKAIKYLAELGADTNISNAKGYTPLLMAAERGMTRTVKYLVENFSADVNAKTADGSTALMRAVGNGNTDLARYLAEKCGADVNARNRSGHNAARLATDRGRHGILRILMPFLQLEHKHQVKANCTIVQTHNTREVVERPESHFIPPYEVELIRYYHKGNIGGDFLAKWLDADTVVKPFTPDTSHSPFEDEVQLWQQLRHPNVTKMYGACDVGSNLKFFVCEYANNGSLHELVSNDSNENLNIWKYLHEAALGLEYLHERGIVHGDLRCSNILIGCDGMAKLSNFGLSGQLKRSNCVYLPSVVGSMRWQAPEILEGNNPSYKSDVYSLGMCILEAVTGKIPWSPNNAFTARRHKTMWTPEAYLTTGYDPACPTGQCHALVWRMGTHDPHKRLTLSFVVHELESLAAKEEDFSSFQLKGQVSESLSTYKSDNTNELWLKVQNYMENCVHDRYWQAFDQLKRVNEHLLQPTHPRTMAARFHSVLTEFYHTITKSPEHSELLPLSSTGATIISFYALQWRIESLITSLGEMDDKLQHEESEKIAQRVSKILNTDVLLQNLKSVEERSAYLRTLQGEMKNHAGKYTPGQLEVLKKTCEEIVSRFSTEDFSLLTPEWFIPWYELIVDELNYLGAGGFGKVYRAKWLDAEVVVKRVMALDSCDSPQTSSLSALLNSEPRSSQNEKNTAKREEARVMFRREVDIWFDLNYPHVVRLFGACHVGRPFFVCEYATNGTLVSFLRKHPDQLWSKLLEAALGVQYLHARNVVHGDLKGNNIVVGSDLKAKVTDFGLSSIASSEERPQISCAWHWVAPECFPKSRTADKENAQLRPTFASDIYSLGMCIVEALRVVDAVRSGDSRQVCLPWGNPDQQVVRYNASNGTLPARPSIAKDSEWILVKRMCMLDPAKRITISTVAQELQRLTNSSNSSQENDLATTSSPMRNLESVGDVIAAAQKLLGRLQTGAHPSFAVVPHYVSLWEKLEQLHGRICNYSTEFCSAFCSLVDEANTATTKLQNESVSLISLAKTTMGAYALHRRVDILQDAFSVSDA